MILHHNIIPLYKDYTCLCYMPDEAMQLMVSKILELSSQSAEGLPEDCVDLAGLNTSGNNSNYERDGGVASNGYSRTGRGISGPPSHSYYQADKQPHRKYNNCC